MEVIFVIVWYLNVNCIELRVKIAGNVEIQDIACKHFLKYYFVFKDAKYRV